MTNIIKKLRTDHAWSQEQLAEMAGLSVRTVQRAENGAPSGIETLKSLAAVFEVSLDTLRSEQTHTQPKDSAEEPKPEDSPMQADATPDHSTNTQTSKLDATKIPASLRPIIRRSVSLLLILAMLTFINLITVPQYLWVQWPALGFGIAIISMWVDWLMQGPHTQEQDNSANYTPTSTNLKEPQTLRQTISLSLMLIISAIGIVIINLLSSPGYLWCFYPLTGIAITLAMIWVRFSFKDPS